jgi:hypothetical protein
MADRVVSPGAVSVVGENLRSGYAEDTRSPSIINDSQSGCSKNEESHNPVWLSLLSFLCKMLDLAVSASQKQLRLHVMV